MPYPNDFYYTEKQSGVSHQDSPSGNFDVSQFIRHGKHYWIGPTPIPKRKQKKLILADWTAKHWERHSDFSRNIISNLMADGFSLYIWQDGHVAPLTADLLIHLDNKTVRFAMTPAHPETIIAAAIAEQQLSYDQIHVLDDFWLQNAIHESKHRSLRFSHFLYLDEEKRNLLLAMLEKSKPALTLLIHDVYSKQYNSIWHNLCKRFPDASVIHRYIMVKLESTDITALISNAPVILDEITLHLHEFTSLKALDLSNCYISSADLYKLMTAAPYLESLCLQHVEFGHYIQLPNPNLANLLELNVSGSNLTSSDLAILLPETPNLKKLSIIGCKETNTDFFLPQNCLPHLETLSYSSTILTTASLASLNAAAPRIQNIMKQEMLDPLPVSPTPKPIIPLTPQEPTHNPALFKDYNPHQNKSSFQFKGICKTKNQRMLIEKICQYFTLNKKNVAVIPELTNGICDALSHYFNQHSIDHWSRFIDCISQWNGLSQTITPELEDYFTKLSAYIQHYQLNTQSPNHNIYLGDNLALFLHSSRIPCILKNPWHAIAIRPKPRSPLWLIYNPNDDEGAREITEENLLQAIHDAIGTLVSVESSHGMSTILLPQISNPESFIQTGGLLSLLYASNFIAIFAQFKPAPLFSRAILDGILLRDVKGIPAWVLCIQKPILADFTFTLLKQFITTNPDDYVTQLEQSMALLSPLEKQQCLDAIMRLFPFSIDRYTGDILLELISNAPTPHYYESELQTWHNDSSPTVSLPLYCHQCVLPSTDKKRLIELDSTPNVAGMSSALQRICKLINRPVFYINVPDDMVCAAPFIERHGHIGILHKGPGGPLHRFLQAHQDPDNPPVLIVNYEHFSADDIVRFNALLDTERHADGTFLPKDAIVIGLMNTQKPNCYRGSDFFSRFDVTEKCPISDDLLAEAIMKLPTSPPLVNHLINLYYAPDWEDRLLGRWILHGDMLVFEEGELVKALKKSSTIAIQNGLWEDADFLHFWQQALLRGVIEHADRIIQLPLNFKICPVEGYDWEKLNRGIKIKQYMSPNGLVLNPSCLSTFLGRYICENETKTLVKTDGIINCFTGKKLVVNVTRTLSKAQWAMFLEACSKHHVQLRIHCAPGVTLPKKMHSPPTIQGVPILYDWNGTVSEPSQTIISTDISTTLDMLIGTNEPWEIIDVSECTPSDLLWRIHGRIDETSLRFEFNQSKGALVEALEANKRIILKGSFSAELADELAAYLLTRQQDTSQQGQLVILSERVSPFHGLPTSIHNVTVEEKLACLAASFKHLTDIKLGFNSERNLSDCVAKESLNMLKARATYMQIHPTSNNSDYAWYGMHHLNRRMQDMGDIDFTTAEKETETFIKLRADAVNTLLTYAPYVFLTGYSGVGKSTFVEKELCQNGDILYKGESRILAWAQDQQSVGVRKILFIDEANLSSRKWSEFEGLFHTPKKIRVDGILYTLTPDHKVVFAGNPCSDGDERKLSPFFKDHGNAIAFGRIPPAVLYQKILKPVFENTPLSDKAEIISHHLLKIYRFLGNCSQTEILISPRELQMIALLIHSHHQQNPTQPITDITEDIAWELAKNLVPNAARAEFDSQFKPSYSSHSIRAPRPIIPGFLITPSREHPYQQLNDLIALRQWRQQNSGNDAQLYGGLGGLVLEGEPGNGKSELVLATLLSLGFEKQDLLDLEKPATSDKAFYHIPVSMPLDKKASWLRKAFNEGAVVVIDEINSSPMMERLLNDLLMGKTPENQRPDKPGFIVIGTQNPAAMAGRRNISTPLKRRLLNIELPPYPHAEMLEILVSKGVSNKKADAMINAYEKQLAHAKKHFLSPVPSFRNLLRLAEKVIRTEQSRLIYRTQEAQTAAWKPVLDKKPTIDPLRASQMQPSPEARTTDPTDKARFFSPTTNTNQQTQKQHNLENRHG